MYRADRLPAPAPFAVLWEAVRAGTPYLSLHGAAFTLVQVPGGAAAIGAWYEEPHLRQQPLTVRIADSGHPITAGVESFTIEDEAVPPDAARADRAARAGVVLRFCPQPSDAAWRDRRAGRLAAALHHAARRRVDTHQRPRPRPESVDASRLSPPRRAGRKLGSWLPLAGKRGGGEAAWIAARAARPTWRPCRTPGLRSWGSCTIIRQYAPQVSGLPHACGSLPERRVALQM